MKILLLNPHIDAQHKIAQTLQKKGIGLIQPTDSMEAWKMLQLHGKSVDLAIIHREGAASPEDGMRFLERLKADPSQADLPLILTSDNWGDAEFAEHQNTPTGANAYLHWPFTDSQLVEMVGALFGQPLADAANSSVVDTVAPEAEPERESTAATQALSGTGLILEDVSDIIAQSTRTQMEIAKSDFQLDDPEYSDEGASPPSAPPAAAETVPVLGEVPAAPGRGTATAVAFASPPAPPAGGGTSVGLSPIAFEIADAPFDGALPLEPPVIEDAPAAGASPPAAPPAPPEKSLSSVDLGDIGPGTQFQVPVLEAAPAPEPEPPGEPVDENELADEMPYLFSKKEEAPARPAPQANPALTFAQPVGDAVVPGGAAHTPDVETLKKYLMLREQDVAILSTQLKAAQEQVASLDGQIRTERARSTELERTVEDHRRKIDDFEKDKALTIEGIQGEVAELKFQIKAKNDKARVLESQVREASEEIERVKDRVRMDIRKIRVREKDLENKLEIVKKDSEALIAARENKIIELKRKIDLLEFNMDLLQDQYAREKENSGRLREKLARAAQVVRVAGGLLDTPAGGTGVASGTPLSKEAGEGEKQAS